MALMGLEGRMARSIVALCDMIGYAEVELRRNGFARRHTSRRSGNRVGTPSPGACWRASSYQMEKRYLHKNGSLVYVIASVSLVRDANGIPVYFLKQIENITQRREIDRMKGEFHIYGEPRAKDAVNLHSRISGPDHGWSAGEVAGKSWGDGKDRVPELRAARAHYQRYSRRREDQIRRYGTSYRKRTGGCVFAASF